MDFEHFQKQVRNSTSKRSSKGRRVQPMGENVADKLMELVKECEELSNKGYSIQGDADTGADSIRRWVSKCSSILEATYGGRQSDQARSFRHSGTIETKIGILKTLAAQAQDSTANKAPFISVNQNVSQSSNISIDISNQISLFIEYSVPQEQKEEVAQLFKDVKEECEKPQSNWDKVTDLLRKSFDYGMNIAPELVKLASAYYTAKGGI